MQQYTISTGQSRNAVSWPNRTVTWEKFVGKLGKCKRSAETMAEYKAMDKDRRATRLEAAPRRFYKFAEYGTR